MELLLVRHGPAEEPGDPKWPTDRSRPLSVDGREKTSLAAAGLAAAGLRPDLVVSSPLVRAEQTAKIVAAAFRPAPSIELSGALAPGGDYVALVRQLQARRLERVALVGHEPSMSLLLSILVTGGERRLDVDFKKAAMALVEIEADRPRGIMLAFLPPRTLRQLGGARESSGE